MNATATAPTDAAAPSPPTFDPEVVRRRWAKMNFAERRTFLRAMGPRAAVREFGLSVVEVALAWRISLPLESRLEMVRAVSRP